MIRPLRETMAERDNYIQRVQQDIVDSREELETIIDASREEEKEIRVMCEQSAIPKALVDIAVSDPDKLDELEKQAEG